MTIRLANSKAGIKPTAPLSAFDKKNSIEFSLDSVHYLYMKSNPNPSFCPALSYESLSSRTSIGKKIKENKIKRKTIIRKEKKRKEKNIYISFFSFLLFFRCTSKK